MQAFLITHSSEVAQARRAVSNTATEIGFQIEDSGRAALVATEMCTNMVKHAGGGELLMRPVEEGENYGIELLALDKGPGIHDVAKCLADGYSTAGSPGTGLGAIGRMSQRFDLYSQPDHGTVVVATLWSGAKKSVPTSLDIGAILVPKSGEQVCGDAWCYAVFPDGFQVVGIDGLGHGHHAAFAAAQACRVFDAARESMPGHLLRRMHEVLRPTRGAAVTVVRVDWTASEARTAGVGNVSAAIATGDAMRRIMSDNGIVGHTASKFRELTYPFAGSSVLLIHSDGLSANWQIDRYPGLSQRHASVIAGVLYRDFTRRRDDAMIVVIKRALA